MNEVMRRHMFAQGGFVRPMQEGGMASMQLMPEQAAPPMMPDPAAQMMPEGMGMEQAAQGAAAQGVDPAQLETMLGDYDQQMTRLGEAEDYESVINSIRGDEMPMAARYDELAGIVGQEDATATPESVLTLMQPVMQIAAVDQGIGGLAQDAMMAPVEGPMAEGIMSTVNMGAAEGPAPVNFRYGGAVQNMNNGGPVQYMRFGGLTNYQLDSSTVPQNANGAPLTLDNAISGDSKELTRMKQLYKNQKAVQDSLLGAGDNEAAYADQKNMTQAQMLFDVAQGALAFASPGDRQMSPAERLAQSFSPVLGNIGIRAGELNKFKQAQEAEDRARDLSAFSTSQGLYATELAAGVAADAKAKADAAAADIAAQELKNDQASALLKANAVLLNGGDPLRVTYGDPSGKMYTSTRIYNVGELAAMKKSNKFVKQEKPGSNTLLTQLYDVTAVVDGVKTTKKGQLLTPEQYATYQKDGTVVLKKSVETAPEFKQIYYSPVDGKTPDSEMLQVGTEAHAKAIRPKDKGGLGGVYNPVTADSYTTIATELLEDQQIDGVVYVKGKVLNLNKTQRADLGPDKWQDAKDAKNAKPASWIQFMNPLDNSDFRMFNINDTSAVNVQTMNDFANATNDEGKFIYLQGTNYSSTKDTKPSVTLTTVTKVNSAGQAIGKPITINTSTTKGVKQVEEYLANGYVEGKKDLNSSAVSPTVKTFVDQNDPSKIKNLDLNSPEGLAEYKSQGSNWLMINTPSMADLAIEGLNLGTSTPARMLTILSTQSTMDAYANNTLDPDTANVINNYLTNAMRLTKVWDNDKKAAVLVPGLTVSKSVMDAIEARDKIGAVVPTIGAKDALNLDSEGGGRVKFDPVTGQIDYSVFEGDYTHIITGVDLTKSQGFRSGVTRFFNGLMGQVKDAFALSSLSGYAGQAGKITSAADAQLKTLGKAIISTARADTNGRVFALDLELLQDQVDGFMPSVVGSDNKARDQLVVVRNQLASMYGDAQFVIDNPGKQDLHADAMKLRMQVEKLLAETTAAISIYDRFISSDPVLEIKSDQAATAPSTSSLTRASGTAPVIE